MEKHKSLTERDRKEGSLMPAAPSSSPVAFGLSADVRSGCVADCGCFTAAVWMEGRGQPPQGANH